MTLEEAAIEHRWARRGEQGRLVWRAEEVHPGEVWDAAVAAERDRWIAKAGATYTDAHAIFNDPPSETPQEV
jgi:hypothetical protein